MQQYGRMNREERESYRIGRQRFEAGDDQGALETFSLLLESCPRVADVHYMVGLVHEREGDLEAATSSLERALEINPDLPEAHKALSVVQSAYDWDWAAAKASLDRALALRPGDPTIRRQLARLLATLGQADESLAERKLPNPNTWRPRSLGESSGTAPYRRQCRSSV